MVLPTVSIVVFVLLMAVRYFSILKMGLRVPAILFLWEELAMAQLPMLLVKWQLCLFMEP